MVAGEKDDVPAVAGTRVPFVGDEVRVLRRHDGGPGQQVHKDDKTGKKSVRHTGHTRSQGAKALERQQRHRRAIAGAAPASRRD